MLLLTVTLRVSRYDGRIEDVRHHAVAVGLCSSTMEDILNHY